MLFVLVASAVAIHSCLKAASWAVSLVESPLKSDNDPPPLSRTLSFVAGMFAAVLSTMVAASYGIVASVVLSLIGKGGLSQWTAGRVYCLLIGLTTGVWFVVMDEDEDGHPGAKDILNKTRPAVFVGNHQTELDVAMLGTVFPRYCSMTAKKSLAKTPILGQFMTLSNTVFLDRANRETSVMALQGATDTMVNRRQSVYLFPEGTRSHSTGPILLKFKTGAFHMACDANVPIVPMVVANYSAVFNIKKRIFRPGLIPIRVMKSVPAPAKDDVRDCIENVRSNMADTLIKLDTIMREWNPQLFSDSPSQPKDQADKAAIATSSAVSTGVDSQTNITAQPRQGNQAPAPSS